jgi:hypothetical protein
MLYLVVYDDGGVPRAATVMVTVVPPETFEGHPLLAPFRPVPPEGLCVFAPCVKQRHMPPGIALETFRDVALDVALHGRALALLAEEDSAPRPSIDDIVDDVPGLSAILAGFDGFTVADLASEKEQTRRLLQPGNARIALAAFLTEGWLAEIEHRGREAAKTTTIVVGS